MQPWNRNQYVGLETVEFVFCIEYPDSSGAFTVGKKYRINYFGNFPWEICIKNNYGGQEIFNIHSHYGDSFCTLKYLRKKKIEVLNGK